MTRSASSSRSMPDIGPAIRRLSGRLRFVALIWGFYPLLKLFLLQGNVRPRPQIGPPVRSVRTERYRVVLPSLYRSSLYFSLQGSDKWQSGNRHMQNPSRGKLSTEPCIPSERNGPPGSRNGGAGGPIGSCQWKFGTGNFSRSKSPVRCATSPRQPSPEPLHSRLRAAPSRTVP